MRPTDGDGSIPRGMPLSFRICPNASGKCATWSDTFIESSEWQTGIAAQPRHILPLSHLYWHAGAQSGSFGLCGRLWRIDEHEAAGREITFN
ncbi:hypothetical protein, partial [Prevotella sp. MGM2]|uniref:hypothetical protein n=1 Tax=Prevotella sp. MGM2 TaxID=2033406 RepID=UPI001056FB3C